MDGWRGIIIMDMTGGGPMSREESWLIWSSVAG